MKSLSEPDAALELANTIQEALIEAAGTQSAALSLEKHAKAVRAEVFLQFSQGTIAEREAEARCHTRYQQIEREWIEAESAANLARAKADGLKIRWETWRTLQATRRAEMTLV